MKHKCVLLSAIVTLMIAVGASSAWALVLETREKRESQQGGAIAGAAQGQETPPAIIKYKPSVTLPRDRAVSMARPAAVNPAPQPVMPASQAAVIPLVPPIESQKLAPAVVVSQPPVAVQAPAPVVETPIVTTPVVETPVVETSVQEKAAEPLPPVAAPVQIVQQKILSVPGIDIMPKLENLVQPVIVPQTAVAQAQPGTTFLSLCYHDVQDADPDQTYVGVTTAKLIEQFAWFNDNGFVPVSVDEILAARSGGKPLPEKAVLLTFDDGYVSFYTRVFPLLKSYNYPAVLAVVDSWMDVGGKAGDNSVDYAGVRMPSSAFLNWNQVREMVKSGLVEVASHTYGSHKGIIANPQGNLEPAVVTHGYNKVTQHYETDAEYAQRLRSDFTATARKIAHETGRAPRIMVWPYGQYNQFAIDAAAEAGMTITMTLDDGFGTAKDLTAIPRYLINADPDLQGFVVEMRDLKRIPPIRAAMVDLDLVYSANPEQQLKNLDAVIARVYAMKIGTVFLKGYVSTDDTGAAREVYFPNRHLPMRADLMNRVAWQLATRTNVKVYGVMPVLAYDFGGSIASVLAWNAPQQQAGLATASPKRVSPFDPAARRLIHDLFEDMGRAVPLDGVVFGKDAMLSDFEDSSAPALAAYAAAGLPASVVDLRADSGVMEKWTRLKTETLISFTRDLVNAVRKYRAPIVSVRELYAGPVLDRDNEEKYAQEFGLFQQNYDYAAVLAMPLMENVSADDAESWLKKLIGAVNRSSAGLQRSIFMLQSVDWRQPKNSPSWPIPVETIAAQMRQLARSGAMNFTFTPDDFIRDQPLESALHGDFSLQTYPYRP